MPCLIMTETWWELRVLNRFLTVAARDCVVLAFFSCREHQQQMDELRRELNKFTEKTHILKIKLEKEIGLKKVREGECALGHNMKGVRQLKTMGFRPE